MRWTCAVVHPILSLSCLQTESGPGRTEGSVRVDCRADFGSLSGQSRHPDLDGRSSRRHKWMGQSPTVTAMAALDGQNLASQAGLQRDAGMRHSLVSGSVLPLAGETPSGPQQTDFAESFSPFGPCGSVGPWIPVPAGQLHQPHCFA